MTRKTLNIAIAAALFASLALVGCKKKQDEAAMTPPPAATEPAMPTPAPMPEAAPAASTASVTSVDLGNAIGADMKVAAPSMTFAPKDTIYASAATNNTAATAVPAKLGAKWTFQDGQVVNEESKDLNLSGTGNTEFHISQANGLPAGKYKVEISMDGNVVQSKDFEIK
jgi:FtsP/CotA-like multicopper oxidase with cupredoxin domain